jgi:hypothetical protein
VLSSPWSLEFVLAVIIGAMLVPGCRAAKGPPSAAEEATAGPSQLSSGRTAPAFRSVKEAGRPETPPVLPAPVGSAGRRQP